MIKKHVEFKVKSTHTHTLHQIYIIQYFRKLELSCRSGATQPGGPVAQRLAYRLLIEKVPSSVLSLSINDIVLKNSD